MSNQSCDSIADLLVAYSDGELPAAEAERIARHMAECTACREEFRLLERSLDLAQQVWQESAAGAPVPGIRPMQPARPRTLVAACAAACGILLAVTVGYWFLSSKEPRPQTARTGPRPRAEQVQVQEESQPQDIDVEELIAREGRAARLAVAVQLLATQPGLEQYRKEAEQYLEETYGRRTSVHPHRNPFPN